MKILGQLKIRTCVFFIFILTTNPSMVYGDECEKREIGKFRFEDRLIPCIAANRSESKPETMITPRVAAGWEIRERFEYARNLGFGSEPDSPDGVWLQRMLLHADLRLSDGIRVFAQLSSAIEDGRVNGPSPVDENRLDLQNAFIDFALDGDPNTIFRVGRQEMEFGSGRLVDVREGTNVRRTWNGVQLINLKDNWRTRLFAGSPVQPKLGNFDDRSNNEHALWGVYASNITGPEGALTTDYYYLGYRNDRAVYSGITDRETRHSVGMRLAGFRNAWDWDFEGLIQFGSFGTRDIRAWTLASTTGYTFPDIALRPRFALSVNVASGDRDSEDNALETFNPLFPRGNYFSQAATLGPRNFYNAHAFLDFHPSENLTTKIDYNSYWRLNKNDAVYSPSGQILVSPGVEGSFVGSEVSLSLNYEPLDRVSLVAIFTHFFPGEITRNIDKSVDIDFLELTATIRY
jgi:hypothetical protein